MNPVDLNNLEAERKTLGVYLHDLEALLGSDLKAHELTGKNCVVYDAMRSLAELEENINPIAVVAEAQRRSGAAARDLETAYLEDLLRGVNFLDIAHVSSYECVVQESAERRALFKDLQNASKAVFDKSKNISEVRESTLQTLLKRSNNRDKAYLEGGAAAAGAGLDYINQLMAAKGGLLGMGTGLPQFDDLIGGLQRGQLIVLAAATGGSKTTLALQLARNALSQNKPVYYASLEMSQAQCVMKMACAKAKVNDQKFRANPNAEDYEKLNEALEELHSRPFYCDDRAGASLSQIRTGAMQAYRKSGGLDLVIVDYLQLMAGEGRSNEPRAVEVGRFANGLKALARDLEVPVIALAQINRAVQNRADKRPVLADLRESGDIENAADIVVFLYREGYYNSEAYDPNLTELIVRKNRFGPQGTVKLAANLANSRFEQAASNV